MYNPEDLIIDLKAMNEGETVMTRSLDSDFLAAFDDTETKGGSIELTLTVHKSAGRYFKMEYHLEGTLTLPCDRCLDDMEQPIVYDTEMAVRFGEEYTEDDDLVTVDESEGTLDIAGFVYEFAVLCIPLQHVHAPGKCNREMLKMLEEHSAIRSGGEDGKTTVDPRWSELEKLKTTLKD